MTARKKTAQHKSFVSKWFYIIVGIIMGYFTSVLFPVKETLSFLDNIHDYVNESTLLSGLATALIITIATSYFRFFWNKRSDDRNV